MYRIVHSTTPHLEDVDRFLALMNTLDQNSVAEARTLFDPEEEIIVTRAPGRLDVMGGIADYSGSLVLQLPLKEATLAALQLAPDRKLSIVSLNAKGSGRSPHFEMNLDDFEKAGAPLDYPAAQTYFQKNPATAWAAYAAGTFLVLLKEKAATFKKGARILIHSEVPEGKGVSSSAALEVAVMSAVAAAYSVEIRPHEMAFLCQKVENLVVGAPCGVMDQMTAVCGKVGQLLSLLCQPAVLQEPIKVPNEVSFWGIDSGLRHSVSGADYVSVRVGAFMGYRIIAALAGCEVATGKSDRLVCINDTKWNGYLANITPSFYEHHFAPHLPDKIRGSEFLARYQGTTDAVTKIEPDTVYGVAKPTAHPIYEHFRVRTFAELLQNPMSERTLEQLGELMYQAHSSYSACGLGSEGTDRLVALARELGTQKGIYGAKITGGGSGGTVAVLGGANAHHSVAELCERYAQETDHAPQLFSGSSPGAEEFGFVRLRNS